MRFQSRIIATAIMLACTAPAQAQVYKARLSGDNAGAGATGSGTAVVIFHGGSTRVAGDFRNLAGPATGAHLHCCTASATANAEAITREPGFPGFVVGVREGSFNEVTSNTRLTLFNLHSGSVTWADAARAAAASGQVYVDIHTSAFPDGELRGVLVPFTFTSAAMPATVSLASTLDSGLVSGVGLFFARDLAALALLDDADLPAVLAQMTPLSVSTVSLLASDGLFAAYDQISNRLGGLREAGAAGSGDLWVHYATGEVEQNLVDRGASVDGDSEHVVVGVDYRVAENLLVGFSLGVQRDDVDFDGALSGSALELQSDRLTVYGELTFGNAFIEGMVNVSRNEQQGARNNSGFAGFGLSDADHEQWGARLAAGTAMALGSSFTLTPQVRFDWSHLELEAYQETGAGVFSLLVEANEAERQRLSLGAQLDWNLSAMIAPFVRVFWGSESGDATIVTSAMLEGGGTAFQTPENVLDDDGYTAGVGINVRTSGHLQGSMGYEYSDNDTYESGMLHARVMLQF